ncbi:AraC family transcriptional regulator [Paenibacillus sp. Marseille-Q4541]|uniref:AraC family transcriptional regulator n=1 Tax=Paenibacillus sp. Marseille-Q4541 TaxID=2831522 RepID=UPI001BACFF75|nr:AraC family transcriptional regulator [Paenibacillus sp. Marseille-Q4541]
MSTNSYFYKMLINTPSEMIKPFLFYVLDLGWFECRPDYRMHRTFFPYSIRFVIRGKGYVVWKGRTFAVNPNQLLFLDLTEEHEYYADSEDPWEIIWVRFGGMQASEYYQMLECAKNPVLDIRDESSTKRLFMELISLFEECPPGYEMTASSHLTQIMTEAAITHIKGSETLGTPSSIHLNTMRQAIRYIEEHYHMPIKIEDVANHVFVSPSYFSRTFKRATGCTVTEYIIKCRLKMAKELLVQNERPLGEIAQLSGFCGQSYFSRVFKQLEGTTPLDYRRTMQLNQ